MRELLGVADRPLERLHRAETPAHHRREALDTELLSEARLCGDPVLHGNDGEAAPPRPARFRIDARRTGGTVAAAEIVHADHEEAARVDGFARPDHVVPPTVVRRLIRVYPGDMMRR